VLDDVPDSVSAVAERGGSGGGGALLNGLKSVVTSVVTGAVTGKAQTTKWVAWRNA